MYTPLMFCLDNKDDLGFAGKLMLADNAGGIKAYAIVDGQKTS